MKKVNAGKINREKHKGNHRNKIRQIPETGYYRVFWGPEIYGNDYNRTILRYLGKLNRLLHEERIDQSEYDDLKKSLLKASEAINDIPRTILDIK